MGIKEKDLLKFLESRNLKQLAQFYLEGKKVLVS